MKFAKRKKPTNIRSLNQAASANSAEKKSPNKETELDVQQAREVLRQLRRKPRGIDALESVNSSSSQTRVKDALDDRVEQKNALKDPTQRAGILNEEKHMEAFINDVLKAKRGDDCDILLPVVAKEQQPYLPVVSTATTAHNGNQLSSIEQDELNTLIEADQSIMVKSSENHQSTANPNRANNAQESVEKSNLLLRGVPEVDLGLEPRLKNIQETHRAQKRLREDQESLLIVRTDDNSSPSSKHANRWFYGKSQSTDANTSAAAETSSNKKQHLASDDRVAKRFIQKIRK